MIKTVPRRVYIFEPEVVRRDSPPPPRKAILPGPTRYRQSLFLILPAVGVLVLVAGYLATSRYVLRSEKSDPIATSAVPIRSVAVMPLENLSGDPAQESLLTG
jgi:hypothetical protein